MKNQNYIIGQLSYFGNNFSRRSKQAEIYYMNCIFKAEYLMKNYGDRGGCYPSIRNIYDTKAEFNNCFIIHSKLFLV